MRYSIEKILPPVTIPQNQNDIFDSFTKQALESLFFKKNTAHFIKSILKLPQIKFLLQKAVIERKDVQSINITSEELAKKAFGIAKNSNGRYVTATDIFSAYLILTEERTNLLFTTKLKEEDLININNWTKIIFDEETQIELKAKFVGIGFGEALVWGWTPETKKYTQDLTFSNIKRRSVIVGREKEYQILIETMQKKENNNVLLVGDVGTGKSNLVERLIYESYEAALPGKLNHRRFLELMVGLFIAGATDRSELETRLQEIIEEVKHSGNVVLYIPEFQNLLGASAYNIDLSGAIFPYLKDGKIPIVATMTKGDYKRFFENNALTEVFSVINLEEPNPKTAIQMLFQKTEEIEEQNKVVLSYKAIVAAMKFADKYELNALLPGTAVELLNDSGNSVHVSGRKNQIVLEDDVFQKVSQKSHIPVGQPSGDEKTLLLNFEAEMHKFIIGQDEAVSRVAEALRRIRTGLIREKPISFLFLGPTGVGKTETAKTLARLYFEGEAHIVRLDMSEYGTEDGLTRMLKSGPDSFLEEVLSHPFSLILLDEFEKANEKILNLFLQVFDDGRMTDQTGKTVSFTNTIIIATSNAGSELVRESLSTGLQLDNKTLLDYLQKNALFSPELLNRFDEIVVFKPLNISEIYQIVQQLLYELSAKMSTQDIGLNFDQKAVEKIANDGFNSEFGARPLRRYIQDNIEDIIARKILSNELSRGEKIIVSLDPASNFSFSKSA